MNRPSFQFYTKDWRSNSKLRRCSPAARGVWIDILCALHDSDEYGVARYPLKELANEVGASLPQVRELVDKGVLKGSDNDLVEPCVYVPRSGRRDGPPVTLIDVQHGPVWYSSRMLKDEYKRLNAGASTRFGASPSSDDEPRHASPSRSPSTAPSHAPESAPSHRQGDGSASSSASALAVEKHYPPDGGSSTAPAERPALALVAASSSKGPPPCPHEAIVEAFHRLLPDLPRVAAMSTTRKTHLAARWKFLPKRQSIAWWERLFAYVGESPFLLGHAPSRNGAKPFLMTLDWLTKSEENLLKVVEGNYHEAQG